MLSQSRLQEKRRSRETARARERVLKYSMGPMAWGMRKMAKRMDQVNAFKQQGMAKLVREAKNATPKA